MGGKYKEKYQEIGSWWKSFLISSKSRSKSWEWIIFIIMILSLVVNLVFVSSLAEANTKNQTLNEEKISKLEEETRYWQQQNNITLAKNKELQDNLTKYVETISQLQNDSSNVQEQNRILERENERQKDTLTTHKQDITQLQKNIQSIQRENGDLQTVIKNLKTNPPCQDVKNEVWKIKDSVQDHFEYWILLVVSIVVCISLICVISYCNCKKY